MNPNNKSIFDEIVDAWAFFKRNNEKQPRTIYISNQNWVRLSDWINLFFYDPFCKKEMSFEEAKKFKKRKIILGMRIVISTYYEMKIV